MRRSKLGRDLSEAVNGTSLSDADQAALDASAIAVTNGLLHPEVERRGRLIAGGLRRSRPWATGREVLADVLPVLHFAEWAQRHQDAGGQLGIWAIAAGELMAACHELNGSGDE